METHSNFNHVTKQIIRVKLAGFITRREHAYEAMTRRGHAVPDIAVKMNAIKALRKQLDASRDWDLKAHLLWIGAMRHMITTLLPYEFHEDEKQRRYRKRIVDLLNYCEDLCHRYATPNLKAA